MKPKKAYGEERKNIGYNSLVTKGIEAAIGFEPMMMDLQSTALPLGYAAMSLTVK